MPSRLLFGLLLIAPGAIAADWTVQLHLHGRRIEGKPLAWSDKKVLLLGRDGRLWEFPPGEAENYRETSPTFRAFSQAEMRGQLLAEFGPGFQTSGTGNYLVVHPIGQRDLWAPRFEEIYRAFLTYFTTRGMSLKPPPFPLVAVVLPSEQDFWRHARETKMQVQPGVVGYYSPLSNRIVLYDQGHAWEQNAATIVHEAAHQIAFNTGVHGRFALPPRWLAEGLGTLFESRGVWNPRSNPRLSDRVNRTRLDGFQRTAGSRKKGWLAACVSSDRGFDSELLVAYSEAWTLTFFLSETEPRKYVQYLNRTASRPELQEYRSPERLRDFTQIFGDDLNMLETRLARFVNGL